MTCPSVFQSIEICPTLWSKVEHSHRLQTVQHRWWAIDESGDVMKEYDQSRFWEIASAKCGERQG